MNKRITEAFANGKAFIPFLTCGDPSLKVTEQLVYAMEEAGADLIVSGAGLPTDLPKYVGESDILLAPIVSTAKSANVILKYWDKK